MRAGENSANNKDPQGVTVLLQLPVGFGGLVVSMLAHVPTLGHVREPSSCGSLRAAGKIRMFSFLPSLIEASRAAWCGVPLRDEGRNYSDLGHKRPIYKA
jgi:hypothetical protein